MVVETPYQLRQWTVEEYHRLAEMGVFDPQERVELLDGQIILMSAKGTAHACANRRADKRFRQLLGDRVEVCIQDPIQLSDRAEPEPDIAIVKRDRFEYANRHPNPSDVLLIVEIADTTLKYDREIKALAYARAGIGEYWILDVVDRRLLVFRQPTPNGYQQQTIVSETESPTLLQFPNATIAVSQLLPPI